MEIRLRPDEARGHAGDVQSSKDQAFDILNDLRMRMDGLSDSFSGRTHDAFMDRLDEWKGHSDSLLDSLEGLGNFLNQAAEIIEGTDEDLARQLG